MTVLISLGWEEFFQKSFAETDPNKFQPARVVGQGKGHYHLQVSREKTTEASITSKFHAAAQTSSDFPTVGDWVAYVPGVGRQHAAIHHILKRKSLLQRKRVGSQGEMQLIAANVDQMLVVTSCNEDFDLKRLGRYIALAKDSGCTPAVLLTKSDLCADPEIYLSQLKKEFVGTESILISSQDTQSMAGLEKFFAPGKTAVLLGSSGVGKSTLTNYLLGFESQKTGSITSEAKGRHTTTARSLRFTRWGGLVMDTPGMQGVGEVVDEDAPQSGFSDVEELMLRCKFTTCQHDNERGCAIQAALKSGELNPERWTAYTKATRLKQPQAFRRLKTIR